MNITLILCATGVGVACFIMGLVTDALLEADFIRQKDEEIRELKAEKKAINELLYRRPDIAYDVHKYDRPTVEIIDIPQPDRTYHMPW